MLIKLSSKPNSAFIRDAQRKAQAKIPNSGMAILMDIGEFKNIHPAHLHDKCLITVICHQFIFIVY